MKERLLQLGLFVKGENVLDIFNPVKSTAHTLLLMNTLAGELDRLYQAKKEEEQVVDGSYIAFYEQG